MNYSQKIPTSLGDIMCYRSGNNNGKTLVFLHGVFFNHTLWDFYLEHLSKYDVITIDMPLHGESKQIQKDWNLGNCVTMLLEILSYLKVEHATIVGHSWGSMVAIRAAAKDSSRIKNMILFNTPLSAPQFLGKIGFHLQLTMVPFQSFYGKQAAKALFGKAFLQQHPEEAEKMANRLSAMKPQWIRQTIQEVVLKADDGFQYIENPSVPNIFVTGKEDYTRFHAPKDAVILDDGHVSPLEQKEAVLEIIQKNIE